MQKDGRRSPGGFGRGHASSRRSSQGPGISEQERYQRDEELWNASAESEDGYGSS